MVIYNVVTPNVIYSFQDPAEALQQISNLFDKFSGKKQLHKCLYFFDWVSCKAAVLPIDRLQKSRIVPILEKMCPESVFEAIAWKDCQEDAVKYQVKKSMLSLAGGGQSNADRHSSSKSSEISKQACIPYIPRVRGRIQTVL